MRDLGPLGDFMVSCCKSLDKDVPVSLLSKCEPVFNLGSGANLFSRSCRIRWLGALWSSRELGEWTVIVQNQHWNLGF